MYKTEDVYSTARVGLKGAVAALGLVALVNANLAVAQEKAVVNLNFSNVVYKQETCPSDIFKICHVYSTDRTFSESGGVSVKLDKFEACLEKEGGCPSHGSVDYDVPANGEITAKSRRFWTPSEEEVFTLKYFGKDEKGNKITVTKKFRVKGPQTSQFD